MPNSFLKKKNLSFGKGFVNMLASCSLVSMNFISQSPLFMWSLLKWWRISMCFVLECWIWFLVRFITLVLSQSKGTLLIFKPKSSNYCFTQRICAQQLPVAMYSASAVERATQACILVVPLRYLRILFAAVRWDSFGFAWNIAQGHTKNMICGLLAVR